MPGLRGGLDKQAFSLLPAVEEENNSPGARNWPPVSCSGAMPHLLRLTTPCLVGAPLAGGW